MGGGDGLGRLAQPHVVGEHEAALSQEAEHPVALIRIEPALERAQRTRDVLPVRPAAHDGSAPLLLMTQQREDRGVGGQLTASGRFEQSLDDLQATECVDVARRRQHARAIPLAPEVLVRDRRRGGRARSVGRFHEPHALHPVAEPDQRPDGVPSEPGHARWPQTRAPRSGLPGRR